VIYSIWHVPSGNLVTTCESERQALDLIRDGVAEHAPTYGEQFVLLEEDRRGRITRIAEGSELVALALSAPPERAPSAQP